MELEEGSFPIKKVGQQKLHLSFFILTLVLHMHMLEQKKMLLIQSQYETYTLITKRKRKGNGCRNSNTFVVKKTELILGQITFSYSTRELNLNWCRG